MIETEALEFVAAQPWPGNVRQLGNVVRQALLLAAGFPISAEHVRLALNRPVPSAASATPTFATRLEELLQAARRGELEDVPAKAIDAAERMIFLRAFELADGNQAKAARWLGVARQTVREKLLHFGHRPGPGSGPA